MNLFIAYRREDTQHVSDRLAERLVQEFGAENVFKDVDSIPLGSDFRKVIRDRVGRCDVLLVVIGRTWLTSTVPGGKTRRLDDPRDFVRLEVETALERDIPMIPLLVHDAEVPREEELPPSLQSLAYRNGMAVRPDPDFRNDIGRLIGTLNAMTPNPAPPVAVPEPDRRARVPLRAVDTQAKKTWSSRYKDVKAGIMRRKVGFAGALLCLVLCVGTGIALYIKHRKPVDGTVLSRTDPPKASPVVIRATPPPRPVPRSAAVLAKSQPTDSWPGKALPDESGGRKAKPGNTDEINKYRQEEAIRAKLRSALPKPPMSEFKN